MSIRPDQWIATRSTPPTHILQTVHGQSPQFAWEGITHTKEQLKNKEARYVATRLSLEDMAKEGWLPMIEPFERHQVREREGERVISYGTSSYGYDVRCADEFKVFTNINSTIIDPKNFDTKSFVDVKSDVCIIPPNSFALARTVEYFRIPRDVLTICLGKSTYARCFTGDTKVALVDGTTASFVELVERAGKGERFWGYSATVTGDIVVAELTAPRKVGHEAVLKVTLDNGEEIRCTPDHKFMLRDGSYVEAKDLKAEDSLMPLYRGVYRSFEAVYQPNHGRSSSEHAAIHNDERWATQEARDEHGVSVEPVEGTHDVYCLTVPEHGNFALESGVFVKNCGIIVNVTPLEPEWEGHVTLEFSNTTNLPAKIYANEGVAQMLFFQSDEDCETSYADRDGKYMYQEGVVVPRV